MVSRDLDVDVQALAYLVTALIHRLLANDSAWWQEFRDELKTDRIAEPAGSLKDKVLERAIGIIEEAIKGQAGE